MTKATLYIGIVLICRVVQAIFNKQSSNEVGNARTLVLYSTYRMAISAALGLILLLAAGNGFRLDGETVLISCCLQKNEKSCCNRSFRTGCNSFFISKPLFSLFFRFWAC